MIPGDGWVAVFIAGDVVYPMAVTHNEPPIIKTPVVYWKETCLDGGCETAHGWVLQDRNGDDLPYPVPAPNVFGFLRYEKIG